MGYIWCWIISLNRKMPAIMEWIVVLVEIVLDIDLHVLECNVSIAQICYVGFTAVDHECQTQHNTTDSNQYLTKHFTIINQLI